jgi:hypothetical protein
MVRKLKTLLTLIVLVLVILAILFSDRMGASVVPEQIFTRIYATNGWGKGSGPGSDPNNAKPYLSLLQTYLNHHDINTIYDLGCGDWQLMSVLKIPGYKKYHGYDLVKNIIDFNIENYQQANVSFYHIHDLSEFKGKSGDLLIVKDVIQHWPNTDIIIFIKEILPRFKYALITNDYSDIKFNQKIAYGMVKEINLEGEPFNMKEDITILLDYQAHNTRKRVYLYKNPNWENNLH